MTLRFRRFTYLTVAPLVVATSLLAQGSELQGRVVTDAGTPIPNATVTLTSVRYSVRTDTLGRFRLAGTPGSTLDLRVAAAGFRDEAVAVVLARGRPVARDFVLTSDDVPPPEVNPSDRVLLVRAVTIEREPIAYANLQVNGGRRYVSDDSGRFTVPVTFGTASLLLRRIGFEPTEVKLAELPDTVVRVTMRPVARTLETQVISVRSPYAQLDLGGFYRRMTEVEKGARVGYFVTPEDLALRNPLNVTDAVEQFPSIRLRPVGGGYLARHFRIEDRNGCPLTVYLDRVRIQPTMANGQPVDAFINELVHPNSIAGIEVYPRTLGTPPEFPPYNITSLCGVVVIWTK